MKNETMSIVGQSLFGFQAALQQSGSSLEEYLDRYYFNKWMGDTLYAAMALRTTFVTAMFTTMAFSQKLTQTLRGTIIDIDSKMPLIGASVVILESDPLRGTITDVNGKFRLEKVPVGRITLQLSYMGYEAKTIPNVEVNSGKEVVLNLNLQESVVKMDEVVVKAIKNRGEALNDMSMLSARSISVEETKRYAGGFDDPSRVVSNFAGVSSTPDGSSDIIVRGNSPKYIQWRLEGIEISNPYISMIKTLLLADLVH